ncbi:MAG TPA: hypothetical protein VNN72_01350 [Polyangiaceae bacterium]|nr:hypothetical protein [Polyangiaceae bacterium]
MERHTASHASGLALQLSVAAGSVLGLRIAYSLAPRLGGWLVPRGLARATANVVWEPGQLLQQFTTYVAALALGLLGAAVVAVLGRLAERQPHGALVVALGATLASLGLAFRIAPTTGYLAVAVLLVITVLAEPAVLPAPPAEPTRASPAPLLVPFAELGVLGWGLSLVVPGHPRLAMGLAGSTTLAYGVRIWLLHNSAEKQAELRRDAAAGVPLLFLPLLALLRAPSATWVLTALAASFALRHFVLRTRELGSRFDTFTASAALTALCSIWFVPAQFRELDSINFAHHEAQHLGWLASALRGKWLMADASLFYGPLREYAVAGWLRLAGVTLEQVRVGSVLLNVLGTGALSFIAYRLARGRTALLLFCGLLLLTQSPLRYFVAYKTHTAFGWADVLRITFATLALAVLDRPHRRTTTDGRIDRDERRGLASFGGINALALFYSQEFGLCALAAVPLALLLDALVRAKSAGPRAELTAAVRRAASYLAGFLLVFGAWVVVYAMAGKASLLLRSLFLSVALPGAGAFASLELPIYQTTFRSLEGLAATWTAVPAVEYLLPPLVYVMTGAVLIARGLSGRWEVRARFQLGLLLFGAASYRFASSRSDGYHLAMAATPAILLLVSLLADAFASRTRFAGVEFPLAACLGLLLAYGTCRSYGATVLLWPRIQATLHGEEMPSRGPKYAYPTLHRAGDIRIPEETVRAADYIRAQSQPQDFVFNRLSFMDGGDLMFLANRRNPTRFDTLAELTWGPQQKELLADLRRNPPALVLGDSYGAPYLDAETLAYLASGWELGQTFGDVAIMKRRAAR